MSKARTTEQATTVNGVTLNAERTAQVWANMERGRIDPDFRARFGTELMRLAMQQRIEDASNGQVLARAMRELRQQHADSMPTLQIDRATERDLRDVVRVDASASDSPLPAATWRWEVIGNKHARCYVARTAEPRGKEGVAGVLCFHIEGKAASVKVVAVHPQHRRQGIGESLMRDCIAYAMADGCRTLDLWVRSDNTPAVQLYTKLGFVQVGERTKAFNVPTPQHEIRMQIDDLQNWGR